MYPDPTPQRVEMVPPTVREPVPLTVRDRKGRGGGAVVASIVGVLLLIGALVLVGRAVWGGKSGGGRGPVATSTATGTAPAPTVAPPATALPTGAVAGTTPTGSAVTPPVKPTVPVPPPASNDACHLCIHHALADRCDEALKFRKLCPDHHPNHRDAHVTFDLHCKQ